jgi:signal recognition particle GTPase
VTIGNPHFTNAITWAKNGVSEINKGLAQAEDEYKRLELIHKEDSDIIDQLLKQISAANTAIKIGMELIQALRDNPTWDKERAAYTTEQTMALLTGIKNQLNANQTIKEAKP